jgi:branched-subunit amino acid ABC-type transport system permease component
MYRTDFLDKHPFTALFVIFVVAMAISTIIAYFLEKIAYRPLRGAPRLIPLITAIGASFFLQYMFRGLYGSGFQAYPIAAIFLMAALYGFIMLTRGGKAIRAISEDKEASSLMGINVDGMISTTFVIGGMSAGAAGVLYALMFKQVHFFMGFMFSMPSCSSRYTFSWDLFPESRPLPRQSWAVSATSPGPCWEGFSWVSSSRLAPVSFWTVWESSPHTS